MSHAFPDYPTSWGDKRVSVFWHRGPTSYVQIGQDPNEDYFLTGDHVEAAEAGLKAFDFVWCGPPTDDATHLVYPVTLNSHDRTPVRAMQLLWMDYATQVAPGTNLSTYRVRVFAIGPK